MVIPMKKYAFLVYHADYLNFLAELRKLGVLDVAELTREVTAEIRDNMLKQKQISDSLKILRQRTPVAMESGQAFSSGEQVVERIKELLYEQDVVKQQLTVINKEILNLEPWGDFSPEILNGLKEAGLHITFHVMSEKKFKPSWVEQYAIGIINHLSPLVYFILVRDINDTTLPFSEAEEIKTPALPLSEAVKCRDGLLERLEEINRELDHYAATAIGLLEKAFNDLSYQTDFKRVIVNTQADVEEKVMILQGFVPAPSAAALENFCEERKIVYLQCRPDEKDKIPVLLHNNRFARLFEPISRLFSLPSYNELDLTPLFAPFFLMFFGFCLGDAGYGLLVLLAASLYKPQARPAHKPYLSLAQYLGVATFVFGLITGTFFGINLVETSLPGKVKEYFLDSQNMFYLALGLGLVQIIFGMFVKVLNITRQRGFAYALSTAGWLVLILGLLFRQGLVKSGILPEGEKVMMYSVLATGGLFILFLNNPRTNIFKRVGMGVWDVYGMVTGIFGDLLSYIRLFALGISSAILGLVINSIGLSMLKTPVVGPVLFVLFLFVGHTANILISSLGAFVHPMRLTFVEFYKNAGFRGGGKAYKPFAEKT